MTRVGHRRADGGVLLEERRRHLAWSPFWVSGWHAPLLKLTKAAIIANRDDTHILHRLIHDLFAQLQERLALGVNGPAAFGTLLTEVADYFDRAPRGAGLATLQQFGVPSGTLE